MKSAHLFFFLYVSVSLLCACRDKTADPVPNNPTSVDSCDLKKLTLEYAVTPSSPCFADGNVVVKAGGSTGFMYKLDDGDFQADSGFSALGVGHYKMTVRDQNGCTRTGTFSIPEKGAKVSLKFFITSASKCLNDGKVIVRAASSGFMYKLGNGSFQEDSVFSRLAAGQHSITVKDMHGCIHSDTFRVGEDTTRGPKFEAAFALIQMRCSASCHATAHDGAPREVLNKYVALLSGDQ